MVPAPVPGLTPSGTEGGPPHNLLPLCGWGKQTQSEGVRGGEMSAAVVFLWHVKHAVSVMKSINR